MTPIRPSFLLLLLPVCVDAQTPADLRALAHHHPHQRAGELDLAAGAHEAPLRELVRRAAVDAAGFHRADFWVRGEDLDFSLRLNMKGPGVLLTPMYKLFEYAGTGSLKKPDWHPKVF